VRVTESKLRDKLVDYIQDAHAMDINVQAMLNQSWSGTPANLLLAQSRTRSLGDATLPRG
jgi:hypothetical protein